MEAFTMTMEAIKKMNEDFKKETVEALEEQNLEAQREADESVKKKETRLFIKEHQPEVISELMELRKRLGELLEHSQLLSSDAAKEFMVKFEGFRIEDQKVIMDYLNTVTKAITDFVSQYQLELGKMAEHRKRVEATLDVVDMVLKRYY